MQLHKNTTTPATINAPKLERGRVYYRKVEGAKFGDKYEFVSYTHTQFGHVYGYKCNPLGVRDGRVVTRSIPPEIVDELQPVTRKIIDLYELEVRAGKTYAAIKKAAREMAYIAENAERAAYCELVSQDIRTIQLSLFYAVQEVNAADEQTRPA